MCLYAQLAQTKNTQCKRAIISVTLAKKLQNDSMLYASVTLLLYLYILQSIIICSGVSKKTEYPKNEYRKF